MTKTRTLKEEDGFRLIERDEGCEPRYWLERYEDGEVVGAWGYATYREMLEATLALGDFYYGSASKHDSH